MTTDAKTEFKGLTAFVRYLSCLQCRKKIADGSFSTKILKSRHCGLTQKNKCLENCCAQVKVSQDDNQFVVTFFHEGIQKIFELLHLPLSVKWRAGNRDTSRFPHLKCNIWEEIYNLKKTIWPYVMYVVCSPHEDLGCIFLYMYLFLLG